MFHVYNGAHRDSSLRSIALKKAECLNKNEDENTGNNLQEVQEDLEDQ